MEHLLVRVGIEGIKMLSGEKLVEGGILIVVWVLCNYRINVLDGLKSQFMGAKGCLKALLVFKGLSSGLFIK